MAGLAGLLHQKGYNVTLASYYKHESDEYIEKRYGFRSVLIDAKSDMISKLLMVRRFIKRNGFDVVIAYKDGPTMIASIVKLLGGNYRLIVSERNTTQILSRRDRIKFFLYRWADVIVPNSNAQGDYIRNYFPHLSNITKVITNFTDTNHFVPAPNHIHPHKEILNILITGRIAKQKNVLRFLEVAKKIRDKNLHIKIDWYGSAYVGAEGYGEDVKRLYEKLNINDVLKFHEATSNILTAYQNCDIFCLPSLYEGYPNVVCEAMSCGKPILCSDVCDNSTIIEDGVNGYLFDPLNEDDIVEKIERMINLQEEERLLMGKKSREIAEMKFSEEIFVNKYIELIDK